MVSKFDVYWYDRDGQKLPCVVVSPNELNAVLPYVMIAPITQVERKYPCRVGIRIKGKQGQIALDMLQTVKKAAFVERMGTLPTATHAEINNILKQLFV